jgi:hypothetical protein
MLISGPRLVSGRPEGCSRMREICCCYSPACSLRYLTSLTFFFFWFEADKAGRLRVVALRNGSAVQRSDCLQVGDTISAINGTKVNQMKADDINQILRASNERIHLEIEYELPPTPSSSSIAGNSFESQVPPGGLDSKKTSRDGPWWSRGSLISGLPLKKCT